MFFHPGTSYTCVRNRENPPGYPEVLSSVVYVTLKRNGLEVDRIQLDDSDLCSHTPVLKFPCSQELGSHCSTETRWLLRLKAETWSTVITAERQGHVLRNALLGDFVIVRTS